MRAASAVLAVIWLVTALFGGARLGGFTGPLGVFEPLALTPSAVLHRGFVWQLATYALLHDPGALLPLVFTVLGLWWMGSPLEARWGPRRVLGLMLGATVAGGVAVVLVSLASATLAEGVVVSPTAAVSALLAAWCALHTDARVSFLGLATLTGRQLLGLLVGVAVLQFAWQRDGAGLASLVGFATGHLYATRPRPPMQPRRSGPNLRVVRGGGLPN